MTSAPLTRAGDRRGRRRRPDRRRPRPARAPARRAVARRVGQARAARRARRPDRRRHGRLGDRRRARARGARRPRLAPDRRDARLRRCPSWTTPDTTVLCASYSGNTEETLAAFEAAGALGARRVVATTGGKLAAAAREEGVPVIPLPGGFQPRAAVGYMLVIALEVAALVRRRPSRCTRRSTSPPRTPRSSWPSGAPTAPRTRCAKQLARALHGTIPLIAGAGLDRADRLPLEDADQREREDARRSPRELPELDHNEIAGWDGARGARPLQRRVPRRLRPASARAPADRADARPDRRRRAPARSASRAAARRAGAARLARAARRPRLALPRRAARGRPDARST